jgi:hypothetical protein
MSVRAEWNCRTTGGAAARAPRRSANRIRGRSTRAYWHFGPVPVRTSVAISNGKDLASGVTGAQASALNRPNNRVTGHNVQIDPFGPVAQPAPY